MEADRKKLLLTLARNLDAQTESIRKGTLVPNRFVFPNAMFGIAAKKELGIPLNQPTPVDVIAPKKIDVTAPKKKYASIGKTQMRSGRRSTIQTSSTGLLSKATIGKKTLLGG
jgi:hypothetical protein